MVAFFVGCFRFFYELPDLVIAQPRLPIWNAHIFDKEIGQSFFGRVCPAEQLPDVVISPCFAFSIPCFIIVVDHLHDDILVVDFLGQAVDAAEL